MQIRNLSVASRGSHRGQTPWIARATFRRAALALVHDPEELAQLPLRAGREELEFDVEQALPLFACRTA